MKKKILALSVHPNLSASNVKGDISSSFASNIILSELQNFENVTIHPIAEEYPDLVIDVYREQDLLKAHDTILMIGPIYWYNLPAIAKQWIDDILLYGWAYGSTGKQLMGKDFQLVLTAGSELNEFCADDIGNTLEELFVPYQRTFEFCSMRWMPIRFIGDINSKSINTKKAELTEKLINFSRSLIADS